MHKFALALFSCLFRKPHGHAEKITKYTAAYDKMQTAVIQFKKASGEVVREAKLRKIPQKRNQGKH